MEKSNFKININIAERPLNVNFHEISTIKSYAAKPTFS